MTMFDLRSLCLVMSMATSGCFHQGDLNGRPCEATIDCTEGLTCIAGACTPVPEQPAYQPCTVDEPCDASGGEECSEECSCAYAMVSPNECPHYTAATGQGDGGGKVFEICGEIDQGTGAMTIDVRRYDDMIFEDRPYQVQVSLHDEDCGPVTHYYKHSSSDPVGESTSSLRFDFPGEWEPEDYVKDYCVTASKQAGDPDYDPTDPEQTSWWWSEKIRVERICFK